MGYHVGQDGISAPRHATPRHAMPCHAMPRHAGQRHRIALSVYLPSIRRGCLPLLRLEADFYRGFAWPPAKRFALTRLRLRFGCCASALCFHLFPSFSPPRLFPWTPPLFGHTFSTRRLLSAQKALLLPRRIFYLHPGHHRVPRYFRPSALYSSFLQILLDLRLIFCLIFSLFFFSLLLISFIFFIVVHCVSQRVVDIVNYAANSSS